MSEIIISGIQQIGVGIPDVYEAWQWYRKHFGMDVPVFDDAGKAELMLPYTGGQPRERHAVLAINLQGGGGFEIWQYKSRTPEKAAFDLQLGDLGIFIGKIKSKDVKKAYNFLSAKGVKIIGELSKDPKGDLHFYVEDKYGNLFEIVENNTWFAKSKSYTGGPSGVVLGVSDIEKSKDFYAKILGYDKVIYQHEDVFSDFEHMNGGKRRFKRALLGHSRPRRGAFSRLMGETEIELVQLIDDTPRKIFENRMWGDLGFIHLCFDIRGMEQLKTKCAEYGSPFTVDSGSSFDMGEAAGRFSYIEDPDGALIEFVETNKIPLVKKLGLYVNLAKRQPEAPLPDWLIKMFRFVRVKN